MKNYIKALVFSMIILGGLSLALNAARADWNVDNSESDKSWDNPTKTKFASTDWGNSNDIKDDNSNNNENDNSNANDNSNTNNVIVQNNNSNSQSQKINLKVVVKQKKESSGSSSSKKTTTVYKTIYKRLPRTGSSAAGLAGLGVFSSLIAGFGVKRYFWKLTA